MVTNNLTPVYHRQLQNNHPKGTMNRSLTSSSKQARIYQESAIVISLIFNMQSNHHPLSALLH